MREKKVRFENGKNSREKNWEAISEGKSRVLNQWWFLRTDRKDHRWYVTFHHTFQPLKIHVNVARSPRKVSPLALRSCSRKIENRSKIAEREEKMEDLRKISATWLEGTGRERGENTRANYTWRGGAIVPFSWQEKRETIGTRISINSTPGGGIVRSGARRVVHSHTSGSSRKTLSSREQTRWAEKLAAQVSNRNESAMVSGVWASPGLRGRLARGATEGTSRTSYRPVRSSSPWPVSGLSAT